MSRRLERVEALMPALDRLAAQSETRAREAEAAIGVHKFAPYYDYRASLDEHDSAMSVIEGNLAGLNRADADRMRERLQAAERRMLGIVVRSAFGFFFALSAIPLLPYGVKEMFARELQALHDARTRLTAPEHAGKLPPELEQDVATAEAILLEVMDKAPSLTSFD